MSTKTRLWVLGTVIVCGALILFGVAGGLMPQLASASSTNALADDAEQLNDIQRAQLTQLENAQKNIGELESQLEDLRKAIPDTAGSADWIAELHDAERASGVRVTAFDVQVPLSDETAAQAAPAAEESADGGDAAAEDSSGESTAPSTDAEQPQASGASPIPITLVATGESRADVAEFMRAIQAGDRLFAVQSVQIVFEESENGPPWKATATGSLFYAAE